MTMNDMNNITTLYHLAQETEKSKECVLDLVNDKIYQLRKDINDLETILQKYESLEKELRK